MCSRSSERCFIFLLLGLSVTGQGAFDDDGQQMIIDAHNDVRSQFALGTYILKNNTHKQPAANMRKMTWDKSLELTAQNVSDQCIFAHSTNRISTGENLYKRVGQQQTEISQDFGKRAVNAWWNELQKYDWPDLHFNHQVGHATQNLWARTHRVGCGATLCGNNKTVIVTCHYKPPGNYPNTRTYIEGPACSLCPQGTVCEDATGLCVVTDDTSEMTSQAPQGSNRYSKDDVMNAGPAEAIFEWLFPSSPNNQSTPDFSPLSDSNSSNFAEHVKSSSTRSPSSSNDSTSLILPPFLNGSSTTTSFPPIFNDTADLKFPPLLNETSDNILPPLLPFDDEEEDEPPVTEKPKTTVEKIIDVAETLIMVFKLLNPFGREGQQNNTESALSIAENQ